MKPVRSLILPAVLAVVMPWGGLAAPSEPKPSGDQLFRIIQTVQPQFPTTLDTMSMSEGEARIIFNIDAEGRLVDLMVASYTHPAFANEAVKALRAWRYEPARQYGEPIGVRASMVFRFEARGKVVSVLAIDSMRSLFDAVSGPTITTRVVDPLEVDGLVQTLHTVQPAHPGLGERNDLSEGKVVIDFYIDEEGRPRMPVVDESDDPAFSIAAVNALMQWRYTIPTRRGRPVAVRAKQAFHFSKLP